MKTEIGYVVLLQPLLRLLIYIYVYMYTCSFIAHILLPLRRFIYYSLRVYSLFHFKYCLFCVYIYIFINLFVFSFLNLFTYLFIF